MDIPENRWFYRRKGNVWYIGGINGTDDKQTLTFTLDALPGLGKKIAIFKDGSEERQLDIKRSRLSKGRTSMSIDCLPRGGFVAVIE
ncbi:MAG: glycoside hydrolase family 97 C-terminal domain-containing protein [Bacteroides ovatus]